MSLCGLAEEVEVFSHERGEFIGVVPEVVQDTLDGDTKLRKGRVEAIAGDVRAQKLPESLDQVEIRGVGRQEQQGNVEFLRQFLHPMRALVAGIVPHHEDGDGTVGMGHTECVQQLADHLGITRHRILNHHEGLVVGGIGPTHVEAIPAGIGLQFHGAFPFDPAVSRDGLMQQVRRIHKIDPTRWP